MQTDAVCVNYYIRLEDKKYRLYLLGVSSKKCGVSCSIRFDEEQRIDFSKVGSHPICLMVLDTEKDEALIYDVPCVNGSFDVGQVVEELGIRCLNEFDSVYQVYLYGRRNCKISYTDTALVINGGYDGIYLSSDSQYVDDPELRLLKYEGYERNHNKHYRRVLQKMVKGKSFSGEDFCQLLLNRRTLRNGENNFTYMKCRLYTTKFVYECVNDNITIYVQDRKYSITRMDMYFNEFYVYRLLLASKNNNLEEVIKKYYVAEE